MFRAIICGAIVVTLPVDAFAQSYQRPPKAVTDILDAAPPQSLSVSPTGENVFLVRTARYPSIEEVAAPQLRLAGLRIDPKTNGPARPSRVTGLTLVSLPSAKSTEIELPKHGKASFPIWSPDGKLFAIMLTTPKGIELWAAEIAGAKLERVPDVLLNAAIGEPLQWLPGSEALLVQLIPAKRGDPPVATVAPSGPVIQESDGKAAPVRTYQDLLQNPHDAALFDYYCTSQLAMVNLKTNKIQSLGEPSIVGSSDPSPDGEYFLRTRIVPPFSYLHPYSLFPHTTEVLDGKGTVVATVVKRPLQDKIPIEGVPTGPRSIRWIPTNPHSLIWVEAQDDGDPKKKVPHRELVFTAAVGSKTVELAKLEHRFAGLDFLPTGNRMLVRDYDRERKWGRTFLMPTTALLGGEEPKLLFDRSVQDRYGDPGSPVGRTLPSGHRVIRTAGDVAGDTIWLSGHGATPKGEQPFLDKFDVTTGKAVRVFHCKENAYEDVAAILDVRGNKFIVRRESQTTPPNYVYIDNTNEQHIEKQLTDTADPWPELRKARKELVTTKRSDGTTISFTLYLPPDHKEGEKIPAVFYAYPVEFASADTAGQVTGSPHRFTTVTGYSHLFFLAQGYAVLEVSMPVVGPPATANDTFTEQLVSNAKAAIEKAGEFGIDTSRVGVMGHSYGAFMTANLLAHSSLFRAGIARSGAYNRTLTPFGFQNERRTFWEAPDVYAKMSPFNHANKIKEPLLLIHGQADNNPGTFPVQSERMYAAVRANGGTVKLVMLPNESHGYEARESVEHVLYEQLAWFDKYVKAAKK
jgi:dipeptidyl aminopeptidase/acylaminoacyl peptidase